MAAQRIVLKFGSGILTRPKGNALDEGQFRKLAEAVAGLVKNGAQCIIVSSGAVAAGMPVLGIEERPTEPNDAAGVRGGWAIASDGIIL